MAVEDRLLVSKRSLIALSHALEEACIQADDPERLVVACFQRGAHFDVERARYEQMAANSALVVVAYVEGHASERRNGPDNLIEVELGPGHELAVEWNIAIASPRTCAALHCEDLGRPLDVEPAPELDRGFLARWSFDRTRSLPVAARILDLSPLESAEASLAQSLLDRAGAVEVSESERHLAGAFDTLVRRLEAANQQLRWASTRVEEAEYLAERDELTGALNRRFMARFEARMEADRRMGDVAAILFDLNEFKAVNDTYGHDAGDEVLRGVGRELRTAVRIPDLVVRWGGDEFLVLLPGASLAAAAARAEELVARLRQLRFGPPLQDVAVRASAGVGVLDSTPIELGTIDNAMYAAKRSGGSSVVVAAQA